MSQIFYKICAFLFALFVKYYFLTFFTTKCTYFLYFCKKACNKLTKYLLKKHNKGGIIIL